MTEQSPRIALPYIMQAQAQKHVTHNEALQRLDALTQLVVQGFDADTPPASPGAGDVHALGAAPTGAWSGQAGRLACWNGTAWFFVTPADGWRAWGLAEEELRGRHGTAWEPLLTMPTTLDFLGLGTPGDPAKPLSVAGDASLLSHDGAGHQVTINKAGTTDTAALLLQSDWTGHAEIGLAGNNALSVKVSPDGQAWHTALRADPQAGEIGFSPTGTGGMTLSATALDLDVSVTGAAVQSGPTDDAAGKLMLAEFGYSPANTVGTVSQSGGTPTGAIIERGSNANGDYTRWADGTQICTGRSNLGKMQNGNGTYSSPYYTENISANFAAGFDNLPIVSLQWVPGGGAFNTFQRMINVAPYSITTTGLGSIRAWNTAGAASNNDVIVTYMAIGRWF